MNVLRRGFIQWILLGVVALALLGDAYAYVQYRPSPQKAIPIATTTQPVVESTSSVPQTYDFYTFGAFQIPYPHGWTTIELTKDGSSDVDLSIYPADPADGRYDVYLHDTSEYVNGPDEVAETSLNDSSLVKTGTHYVAALHATAHVYQWKGQYYHGKSVVILTPQGGIEMDFISSTTPNSLDIVDHLRFATSSSMAAETAVSAKYIGSHFSMNNDHVYYYGKIVAGADPSTFVLIGTDSLSGTVVGRDKAAVYETDGKSVKIIQGADPATFSLSKTDSSYATDKNHSYHFGLAPGAESELGPYGYNVVR